VYCLVMSRRLVAALALVAGAQAAPTVVLSNHGAGGDAARRVTYESLTQTDVLDGVLRAAGVTPAASGAQWEEELVASLEERPRLVAVLLTEAYGGKQVRPVRQLCFHCTAADRQLCAFLFRPGAPDSRGRCRRVASAGQCRGGGAGFVGGTPCRRRGGCAHGGGGREPTGGVRLVPSGASTPTCFAAAPPLCLVSQPRDIAPSRWDRCSA